MYSVTEFEADAATVAATLHLAYRRCQFLLPRWYSVINNEISDPATINLMSRAAEGLREEISRRYHAVREAVDTGEVLTIEAAKTKFGEG